MSATMGDICAYLNNYFDENRYFDTYEISGGAIDLSGIEIKTGQYFRIVGSTFNDGVYQHPAEGLQDETFYGGIWIMAIPKDLTDLQAEINQWYADHAEDLKKAEGPYQSESYAGYSYSLKGAFSGDGTGSGSDAWKNQFKSKLARWRKIKL